MKGIQTIEERNQTGELLVSYVYGDDLISQNRNGAASYYHYDGQLSIRMLTDENETITDDFTYDAYGNLTGQNGATENSYLYAGEQYDSSAGLYYLRARYYDQNSGRFMSRDPFPGREFEPVSLHQYLQSFPYHLILTDLAFAFVLAGLFVLIHICLGNQLKCHRYRHGFTLI